jgi:alpha-N-arabinofuranosidase
MKVTLPLLAACLSAALPLCARAQTSSAVEVNLAVHADRPGATIDRHIYGQFAEHLGNGIYQGVWVGENSKIPNLHGFRKDVIGALRDLKVPVVRWPGGCFADEYHWRDGIGVRSKRPVRLNTNWGGVPETNEFGTHEFLDFVDMIGADAYINGNLGTGSAREMAEWLQYLTSDKPTALTAERARNGHPKPWKIAYFAVGNEAWGCGGNMTPGYYADQYRQAATFLKTPRGARPQLIASGGHDNDTSWTEALILQVPRDMDAISFHYYTIPGERWQNKGAATGFDEQQWISTLSHTLAMDDWIAQNSHELERHDPQNKVSLAVDEWGTWYDPEPGREPSFLFQQNTLRDAVVAALNFNIFHRHADRVRLAAIAQMVNVLQAMILTQGDKMVLTPTYHVFSMFKPFQDATSLAVDVLSPSYRVDKFSVPTVSASAAKLASGAIALALVNLDPHHAAGVSAQISGAPLSRVTGQVLTAASMDARNTFEAPSNVKPADYRGATLSGGTLSLDLPAKSVLVLLLQP